MIRFRLGEIDAARYKGGDAWFVYDTDAIRAMTARQVIELESHLGGGLSIAQAESEFFGRASLAGLLGLLFLARRLSGVVESWDNFDPHLHQVIVERFDPGAEPMPSSGDLGQIEVRGEPADEASVPPTSPAA
jgi:hypothetical protein